MSLIISFVSSYPGEIRLFSEEVIGLVWEAPLTGPRRAHFPGGGGAGVFSPLIVFE